MKFFLLLVAFKSFDTFSVKDHSTFTAVTSFDELENLYLETRSRESHVAPDESASVEMRKKICKSITSSAYFELNQRDPLDMNVDVLHELKFEAKYEEQQPEPVIFFERILEDYKMNKFGRMEYNYRSRLTIFDLGSVKLEEYAFACMVRHKPSQGIAIYYVSDPYNMTSDTEVRFVCLAVYSCELRAVAEEPAVAFTSPQYPVDDIYLQMRKFYHVAKSASKDPVCKGSKSEKLRICASVMNSSHFVGKVKFIPNEEDFEEECILEKISFRTDDTRMAATRHDHYEWMLPCPVVPLVASASFKYFVSRAYYSHYAVIYSYYYETKEWYIENISGKISPIIERDIAIKVKYREHYPPNLADFFSKSLDSRENETEFTTQL